MGYITRYNLEWLVQPDYKASPTCGVCKTPLEEKHKFCCECGTAATFPEVDILVANAIKAGEGTAYALQATGDTSDSCKWYDHEVDMKAMSIAIPDVLFTLHGEGEESGDIWNKYFLNGKMQVEKAKIVIAPAELSKLK